MKMLFIILLLASVSCTDQAPVLGTDTGGKTSGKCTIKEGENCPCSLCDVI